MSAPEALRIALLASEVTPLSKTGGLADVAGALAKVLTAQGHDVRVFTPAYASVDRAAARAVPVPGLAPLAVRIGSHRYRCALLQGVLPGGAGVYLIDCPELYGRPALYTADADEHRRFLAFTRAALEALRALRFAPQVVHCNDWHTAFAPLFLRTGYAADPYLGDARTLLTIHNIGYQGVFAAADLPDLDLAPGEVKLLHQDDLTAGHINPLRQGILYATAINTVSPTHAQEICTPAYGMGLDDSLRARRGDLSGILNGVDYEEWDPRHDRVIPEHFDPEHLEVKADLKRQFLARLGLAGRDGRPLAGIVSRLAAQKGIELIAGSLPGILAARDLTFVALGAGEPQYEAMLRALQRDFPDRVYFERGYDDALAHWIEAASDLFLMPSRYEPCGLNQMYSLRYGTVPVVRRTGGLADSVVHFDPGNGTGTGVVFNDFDVPALTWAVNTALDWYGQGALWRRLQRNAMAQDFSWTRQGGQYEALYRRLSRA